MTLQDERVSRPIQNGLDGQTLVQPLRRRPQTKKLGVRDQGGGPTVMPDRGFQRCQPKAWRRRLQPPPRAPPHSALTTPGHQQALQQTSAPADG